MPMLAFRNSSLPPTRKGAAIDSMMCCATDSESRAALMCGSTIVNSSPPRARHRVGLAHALPQALGGLAQHVVARLVAERVVDALEMIEVDDEQRELSRLALPPGRASARAGP